MAIRAGAGRNPAWPPAAAAGLPMSVPAFTVTKLCRPGLSAVAIADQMIRTGQHEVVVVGGMESMTRAPHLLRGARTGYKLRRSGGGQSAVALCGGRGQGEVLLSGSSSW